MTTQLILTLPFLVPTVLVWAWSLLHALNTITNIRDAADIARIEDGLVEPGPKSDPESWPQRQTPTDLAAAYEEPMHRQIEWNTDAFEQLHHDFLRDQRHRQQAQEWLDGILVAIVDERDRLVSV